MKVTKSLTSLLLLLLMFFSACKRDIPAEDVIVPIINKDTTVVDSVKGVLLFHENFQNWNRAGYVQPVFHDCQTDLMTSWCAG